MLTRTLRRVMTPNYLGFLDSEARACPQIHVQGETLGLRWLARWFDVGWVLPGVLALFLAGRNLTNVASRKLIVVCVFSEG